MSTLAPLPFFNSPEEAVLWMGNELESAIATPGHPWNMGVITYTPPLPIHPSVKTIVWREVDLSASRLSFYTDIRSAKWDALKSNPLLQGLLWCPQRWVQLSLSGHVTLSHGTPDCRKTFDGLTQDQQSAYISVEAPGADMAQEQAPPLKTLDPALGDRYFGRVDFAVTAFDLVSLHRAGHQRVQGQSLQHNHKALWVCP